MNCFAQSRQRIFGRRPSAYAYQPRGIDRVLREAARLPGLLAMRRAAIARGMSGTSWRSVLLFPKDLGLLVIGNGCLDTLYHPVPYAHFSMMVTKAMVNLSEDFRGLAVCYQELAERSAHPRFREGFANLAARYHCRLAGSFRADRAITASLPVSLWPKPPAGGTSYLCPAPR